MARFRAKKGALNIALEASLKKRSPTNAFNDGRLAPNATEGGRLLVMLSFKILKSRRKIFTTSFTPSCSKIEQMTFPPKHPPSITGPC